MSGPQDPGARRTSPWVLLLDTVTFRQARSVVPVVLAIVAGRGLDDGPTTVVLLVVGVTLLSLLSAAVSWWRFSYTDGATAVVVSRGVLSRSVRTVPIDRIRGVEIEAPALHRMFHLVRVRIDAAAGSVGGKAEELVVDGVPPTEGDRLRARLLSRRGAGSPPRPDADPRVPEPEVELARFDPRSLRYAPLVGSYLAVPLAAVGALLRGFDEVPDSWKPHLGQPSVPGSSVVLLFLVVVVFLLVAGSVVGCAVVNWRFRLVRRGGSLTAVRGLVTRRHTELEIDRIRGWTISQGLGMRLVGAARVSALVTGLGDAARRGQLLPLGPQPQAAALAGLLVTDPGPLRAHPAAARRRSVVRASAPGVLVLIAGAVLIPALGRWEVLVAGAVLTVLGVPLGLARYAALGHTAGPQSFAVRSGWLVQEHTVLQRRAVVGWQVRQTVVQRRAGLATLLACVGAGSGGYRARDMAADQVADLARSASGPWAATLDPTGSAA